MKIIKDKVTNVVYFITEVAEPSGQSIALDGGGTWNNPETVDILEIGAIDACLLGSPSGMYDYTTEDGFKLNPNYIPPKTHEQIIADLQEQNAQMQKAMNAMILGL